MFGRWFGSPKWREIPLWALDLETSGLDPRTDMILSVGMVPVRDGTIRWGERYYSLVALPEDHRPSEEAMRIHHILPEEASHAPPLHEVLGEVLRRLDGAAILVHYGKLDLGFLRWACRKVRRPWTNPPVVDTVRLLGRMTFLRRRLDPFAESLPADLSGARAEFQLPAHVEHHALADAVATAELFLALADRLGAKTLRHLR